MHGREHLQRLRTHQLLKLLQRQAVLKELPVLLLHLLNRAGKKPGSTDISLDFVNLFLQPRVLDTISTPLT